MLHNLCFHIIINYYYRFFWIFLLLVAIFIIVTIIEFLRIFVLMPAEPIPNNLLYCFKAQKFGILYQNSITSICILQSLKRKLLFFVISIMLLYPPLLCVDLLLLLNIVVTRGPPRTSLVVS